MLRSPEQREMREAVMRQSRVEFAAFEEATRELLDLGEAAVLLKVSRSTARRLLRNEPGVHLLAHARMFAADDSRGAQHHRPDLAAQRQPLAEAGNLGKTGFENAGDGF